MPLHDEQSKIHIDYRRKSIKNNRYHQICRWCDLQRYRSMLQVTDNSLPCNIFYLFIFMKKYNFLLFFTKISIRELPRERKREGERGRERERRSCEKNNGLSRAGGAIRGDLSMIFVGGLAPTATKRARQSRCAVQSFYFDK